MSRTRWLITSVGVGVAIAVLRLTVEPGAGYPTISQRDFERGLFAGQKKEGSLSEVTVLPEQDGKTKVVAREVYRDGPAGTTPASRHVAFIAEKPYRADVWEGNPTEFPDVVAYLNMVLSGKGTRSFRYAWWDEDWAIYVSSVGASVVLLGVLLPAIRSFLHRRRFGPSDERAAASLAGVRSTAEAKRQPAPGLTEEERARLATLNAQLEESVGAGAATDTADTARGTPAAPLRRLEPDAAGPEGQPTRDADEQQAPREYQGEFYPVAKPGGKGEVEG